MTLKEVIASLAVMNPATIVNKGFSNPHSWRGIYAELSFEPAENVSVGDMLKAAQSAVGATYEGWKGGSYTMGLHTEVHLDREGEWNDQGEAFEALLAALTTPTPAPVGDTGAEEEITHLFRNLQLYRNSFKVTHDVIRTKPRVTQYMRNNANDAEKGLLGVVDEVLEALPRLAAALTPAPATAVATDTLEAAVAKWLDPNRGPRSEWQGDTQILHPVLVAREDAEEPELAYWCDMNDEWLTFENGERERIYDVEGWQPLPAMPLPATPVALKKGGAQDA